MFRSEFAALDVPDAEFDHVSLLFVSSASSAPDCYHHCGPYVNASTSTACKSFESLRNRLIDARVTREKEIENQPTLGKPEEIVELHVAMPCDVVRHGHNWFFLHEDTDLTLKKLIQQHLFVQLHDEGLQLVHVAQTLHTQLLSLIESWSTTHHHFLPNEAATCPHGPRSKSRYPLLFGTVMSLDDVGVFRPLSKRIRNGSLLRFFLRNTAVGLVAGNTMDAFSRCDLGAPRLSASLFVSPQLLHGSRSEWLLADPSDDVWTAGIITLHVLIAAFSAENCLCASGDDSSALVCVVMDLQTAHEHAEFCRVSPDVAIRNIHRGIGTLCRLALASLSNDRLCLSPEGLPQRFCRFLTESLEKHEERLNLREFFLRLFESTLCLSPSSARVEKWEQTVPPRTINLLSRSPLSLRDVRVTRFDALYNLWKANRERVALTQNGSMNSLATKHSAVFAAVLELIWSLWLDFPHRDNANNSAWESLATLHAKEEAAALLDLVTGAGLLQSYLPTQRWLSPLSVAVSNQVLLAAMRKQGLLPKGVDESDAIVSPVALCSTSCCAPQVNGSLLDGVLGTAIRRVAHDRQHDPPVSPLPKASPCDEFHRFRDSIGKCGPTVNDVDAHILVRSCRKELIRLESGSPNERMRAQLAILDLLGTSMMRIGQSRQSSNAMSPSFLPAVLRGELWWAMLSYWDEIDSKSSSPSPIPRNRWELKCLFETIDTDAPNCNDRQIAVDIPRCHQYDPSLCSSEGHSKLMRVVKAWLSTNPTMVYWQGIDSIAAILLSVTFEDESLAFGMLSLLMRRWVPHFFVAARQGSMDQRLLQLHLLLKYFDPQLANHLDDIGCKPELFSISWFLTVFAHVLPLERVCKLWDFIFLTGSAESVLCVACTFLMDQREALLKCREFSPAIALLSTHVSIHHPIEQLIWESNTLLHSVPSSVLHPDFDAPSSSLVRTSLCCLVEPHDLIVAWQQSTEIDSFRDDKGFSGGQAYGRSGTTKWAFSGGVYLVDLRSKEEIAEDCKGILGSIRFDALCDMGGNLDALLSVLCKKQLMWISPRDDDRDDHDSSARAIAQTPVILLLCDKEPEQGQDVADQLCRLGVAKVVNVLGGLPAMRRTGQGPHAWEGPLMS